MINPVPVVLQRGSVRLEPKNVDDFLAAIKYLSPAADIERHL